MKLVGLECPCIEIAAQLQASNPAFGAGSQSGDVFRRDARPVTWFRIRKPWAGVKRRSAARSSVNWFRPERVPGQGSQDPLGAAITSDVCSEQVLDQKCECVVYLFGIITWVVVKDEMKLSGMVVISLIRVVRWTVVGG